MNNKYLKYFLIVAAIGIWGLIIYRIIQASKGGPDASIGFDSTPGNLMTDVTADTFTLNADYPDPFIPEKEEEDSVSESKSPDENIGVPSPELAPLSEESIAGLIKFRGIVENPQKKIRVAIVSINGREYVVHERDKVEGIYITKIMREKLKINYKNNQYDIEKEH
jgi:hypothetical protein